jgi:hypothetical protein
MVLELGVPQQELALVPVVLLARRVQVVRLQEQVPESVPRLELPLLAVLQLGQQEQALAPRLPVVVRLQP